MQLLANSELPSRDFKRKFLSRISVAVVPEFAQCTNRSTRRKVVVYAQPTKREYGGNIVGYASEKRARRRRGKGERRTKAMNENERQSAESNRQQDKCAGCWKQLRRPAKREY